MYFEVYFCFKTHYYLSWKRSHFDWLLNAKEGGRAFKKSISSVSLVLSVGKNAILRSSKTLNSEQNAYLFFILLSDCPEMCFSFGEVQKKMLWAKRHINDSSNNRKEFSMTEIDKTNWRISIILLRMNGWSKQMPLVLTCCSTLDWKQCLQSLFSLEAPFCILSGHLAKMSYVFSLFSHWMGFIRT